MPFVGAPSTLSPGGVGATFVLVEGTQINAAGTLILHPACSTNPFRSAV
jgi:hypothetical protein